MERKLVFICGLNYTDTDIAQHTHYHGFSMTGYIVNRQIDRTGTKMKQTEVDCEQGRLYRGR